MLNLLNILLRRGRRIANHGDPEEEPGEYAHQVRASAASPRINDR